MKSATKKGSLAVERTLLENRQQIPSQELQLKQLKEEINPRMEMEKAQAGKRHAVTIQTRFTHQM